MNKTLGDIAYYADENIQVSKLKKSTYVTTDCLLPNKEGKVDSENLPPSSSTCSRFKKGDILVSNIRPYLKKIWLSDIEGGCSADVLVFRPKKGYISNFIYYALLRDDFFAHAMKGSKGTKMPRGDKNQLLEFSIPDFDYLQQEKLSEVLSTIDAKIAINKKINFELKNSIKLIHDYWFMQFDFPDKNGNPYMSSGGKMSFCKNLNRYIPEGWSSDYVENILAKELPTKRIPKNQYQNEGATPVIDQSKQLIAGYISDNPETIIKAAEVPRIIFGDHTRILKLINFDFARGADGTQSLLSKNINVPQHFFYHSLSRIDLSGFGYARHFKFLKQSQVIIPNHPVVFEFEKIAADHYKQIRNNIFATKRLEEIRNWILPLLMNEQIKIYT